jgi:hypothetical protein
VVAFGFGWYAYRGPGSFDNTESFTHGGVISSHGVEEIVLDDAGEMEAKVSPPFSLEPGFTAERVAAAPLVKHPMFACFDDRGRLYVACSTGTNLDPDARSAAPPDVIRRLEDCDGDGRFDKSVIFADKLTFPQGVLWHDGAVYTASPPSLWKLADLDGDGVADHRDGSTGARAGFPTRYASREDRSSTGGARR